MTQRGRNYVPRQNGPIFDPAGFVQNPWVGFDTVTRLPFNNFTAGNTAALKTGINALLAGTRDLNILCVGDSLTAGQGDDGTNVGVQSQAYPAKLAALLATRFGKPSSIDSQFGCTNTTMANFLTYNAKFANSGAIVSSTSFSMGGQILTATADASFMTFTPTNQFDRVDYLSIIRATSLGLDVDSATETKSVTGSASSMQSGNWALAANRSVLKILGNGGGSGWGLIGWKTWSSTTRRINLMNSGWRSSKIIDWSPSPTVIPSDPREAIQALQAVGSGTGNPIDLILLMLGTNDYQPTTPSAFRTAYDRFLGQLLAAGTSTVIAVVPFPYATSDVDGEGTHSTQAQMQAIQDQVRQSAAAAGIGWIDANAFNGFGSWASIKANNWNQDTITHLNGTGYQQFSNNVDLGIAAAYAA